MGCREVDAGSGDAAVDVEGPQKYAREVGGDVADAPVDVDPPRDGGVEGNDICGPPTVKRGAGR